MQNMNLPDITIDITIQAAHIIIYTAYLAVTGTGEHALSKELEMVSIKNGPALPVTTH